MAAVIRGDVPMVGDYRAFALKRAQSLGVFASPPSVFEDSGTAVPLASGSAFQASAVSAGGTIAMLPGDPGGVWRVTTAGTNGASSQYLVGAGSSGSGVKPGMIGDPGASGTRWYLLWVFRISSAVDSQAFMHICFRPADNTSNNIVFFGVDGQFVSTTLFMAEENVLNTTTSTKPITSTSTWHYLEAWQVGTANQIKFAFDGEAPLTLTTTAAFNAQGVLFVEAGNGTTLTARSFDSDHICLLMPGNVTLPST